MKDRINALGVLLLLFACGCDQKKGLTVEPIDATFNQEYISGKNMDRNFFSREDLMQYYQVSNFDGLKNTMLLTKLTSVAMSTGLPENAQSVTVLFYEKKPFVDYRDVLFESASENENGHLNGYNEDLLAIIIVQRTKAKGREISIRRLLYEKNKLKLKLTDTLTQ